MISEVSNLPRQLTPEDRFIIALKNELRKHAQEINKLAKNLNGIDLSNLTIDLSDYYTKEEIEQSLENITTEIATALNGLVTETQLEEALANIHIDDIPQWLDNFEVQNNKLCQVVNR